jgi:quercetin dioxygenase-like cupin family protein
MKKWYFRTPTEGIRRVLSEGVVSHIVAGDKAMLSFVDIAPNTSSPLHRHSEEQWGYLISGKCMRIQGEEEIEMSPGDFWLTPGNVPHAIRTGREGAQILDIFSLPRAPYTEEGVGLRAVSRDRDSG